MSSTLIEDFSDSRDRAVTGFRGEPGRADEIALVVRLAIYCADVGSIKQASFGWARVEVRRNRRTGPATCPSPPSSRRRSRRGGREVLAEDLPGIAALSELAEPFGMSLTGMKKHIRLLEEAQLVTTEKVGRVRRCMLAPYAFEGISTWLQRLDRFAQVVERMKGDR